MSGFPTIPEDAFEGFDFDAFDKEVVDEQIELVNSLPDEKIDEMGKFVSNYVRSQERSKRVLAIVSTILGIGLRLAPI